MRVRGYVFTLVLLLATALLSSFSIAASIAGGEITLIRPESEYIDFSYVPAEYLSIEDLTFKTCIEEDNTQIRTSVLCRDDASFEDLNVYPWKDDSSNCFISSYDISQRECGDLLIESEYVKDDEVVKLSQDIKVNRFSTLLDLVSKEQYSDGGWKNATETASGILTLSNYDEIYSDEIALANQWLKKYRDNEFKCWPNEDCTVSETAKILAYLTLAENNDSLRVMHDGLVFLKKWQSYFKEGDKWNLTIRPFESGNTNCIITFDQDHLNDKQFIINENVTAKYQLTAIPNEKLIVICDQNIYANLTTTDNEVPFIYEGDNLSYTIPYACWPIDSKWGTCDPQATAFALLTDLEDERKEGAVKYLESLRKTTVGDEDYILNSSNITLTSLYTYYLGNKSKDYDDAENFVSWLRFKQNNNGSWGNASFHENIMPTAFSILALLSNKFTRNDEPIQDAEAWINGEELKLSQNKTADYVGWNSTEKNALAFTVLKNNARPILKAEPMIILIDKNEVEVDLFNPTTFPLENVQYRFSDKLKDLISIKNEREEIPAYTYIKLDIIKEKVETGEVFGDLIIENEGIEIAKIPVMIVNSPKIDIKVKETAMTVFGTKTNLGFNIVKTPHNFDCTLIWDEEDITSKSQFTIAGKSISVDLVFREAERVENTYNGEFICTARNEEFRIPFEVDISRYKVFPFDIMNDNIFMNETDAQKNFTIINNLDESLDFQIKFAKAEKYFNLGSTTITLGPQEKKNISIYQNSPGDVNISRTNTIEVTALDQKKTITFRGILTAKEVKSGSSLIFWMMLLIILCVIGALGTLAYNYKDKLAEIEMFSFMKKESGKTDKIKMKIKKLEERERMTAIFNMIHIMRMLNKEDKEIQERLKKEGFTDKHIKDAFQAESSGEEDTMLEKTKVEDEK